jgi:hypothetical protein
VPLTPSPGRPRTSGARLQEVLAEVRALAEAVERLTRLVEELPAQHRAQMESLARGTGRGVVAVARALKKELTAEIDRSHSPRRQAQPPGGER